MANDSIGTLRQAIENVREDLAIKLEQLALKLEKRDDILREIDKSISEHNANFVAIEARLVAREDDQPPGILTIVGISLGMATLLASGGGFVIDQITQVQAAEHQALKQRVNGMDKASDRRTRSGDLVAEKQDDIRQRLSKVEGELPLLKERVDDIDDQGSRRWMSTEESRRGPR